MALWNIKRPDNTDARASWQLRINIFAQRKKRSSCDITAEGRDDAHDWNVTGGRVFRYYITSRSSMLPKNESLFNHKWFFEFLKHLQYFNVVCQGNQ